MPARTSAVRFLVCAIAIAAACGHRAAPHQPAAGHLHVRVTDGPGGPPIAARVLFFLGDEAIHFGKKELYDGKRQATGSCMLADGALGTWDGLRCRSARSRCGRGAASSTSGGRARSPSTTARTSS
jgi:hypothetical protein